MELPSLDALWPHSVSPYEVLGLPQGCEVGAVRTAFKRRALETHPDKQPSSSPSPSQPDYTFSLVRDAATLLMDPILREGYEQRRVQAALRTTGTISDTYRLAEGDFALVEEADGEEARYRVYQRECRCGGLYEVVVFPGRNVSKVCSDCDSCSLVVEVEL